MSNVLRELVAKLGFEIDGSQFEKADSMIDGLKEAALGVAEALGGIEFFKKAYELAEFASTSESKLAILEATLGDSAEAVRAWAEEFSNATGRSVHEQQELAGQLSTTLVAMVGNKEAAAGMASKLVELAADMQVAFGGTQQQHLEELQMGLSGSGRELRKYGILLDEASLAEDAGTAGTTKHGKSITNTKKATERYTAIVKALGIVQGRARSDTKGFDGAIAAVQGQMHELNLEIGKSTIPFVEYLAQKFSGLVEWFRKLTENTHFFESALVVLGAAASIALAPMIAGFLRVAAPLLALAVLVDDLVSLFTGGRSVIGYFIDELFGLGAAQQFVENVTAGWSILSDVITDFAANFVLGWSTIWSSFTSDMAVMTEAFGAFWTDVTAVWQSGIDGIASAWSSFKDLWKAGIDFMFGDGTANQVIEWAKQARDTIVKTLMDTPIIGTLLRLPGKVGGVVGSVVGAVQGYLPALGANLGDRPNAAGQGLDAGLLKGPSFGRANAEHLSAPAGGGGTAVVIHEGDVNVNVTGSSDEATIKKHITEHVEHVHRRTHAAIKQVAAGAK